MISQEQKSAITAILASGEVKADEPLARHTTYGIGGPAELFVRPGNGSELVALLQHADSEKIPLTILGSGSNCLVADSGIQGIVISLAGTLNDLTMVGQQVTAGAGVMLGHMVHECAAAGLGGLDGLTGVPGTLGGALVMNAGAYGAEISTHLCEVRLVAFNGRQRTVPAADLTFGYRTSGFKDNEIIIGGIFKFPRAQNGDLEKRREASQKRKESQPLKQRSAGSVFKNPDDGPAAGQLIDQAGLKGTGYGGAEISTHHANFFINQGGASADDVAFLIKLAAATVRQQFGISLQLELKTLGFPEGYWEGIGVV